MIISNFLIAWRNVRQYRSRLAPIFTITVIGCIVGLACAGIVSDAASASERQITEGVALRTIELRTAIGQPDVKSLSRGNLGEIARIPGVQGVEPWLQTTIGIKNDQVSGVLLYATIPQPSTLPPITKSIRSTVFPLKPKEIVVPATVHGIDMSALLGKTIGVDYVRKVREGAGGASHDLVTVVALYDPQHENDGPSAGYADADSVVQWSSAMAGTPPVGYLDVVGYSKANVILAKSEDVSRVTRVLQQEGYAATNLQERLHQLPGSLTLIQDLGIGVIAMLLLSNLLSGLALSSAFIRQRTREIGLLKAVGFRQSRVFTIFLLELGIIGFLSAAVGTIAGNVVSIGVGIGLSGSSFLGVTMPHDLAIPGLIWSSTLLILPAMAILVGGLLPARRAAAMQPDIALKDW